MRIKQLPKSKRIQLGFLCFAMMLTLFSGNYAYAQSRVREGVLEHYLAYPGTNISSQRVCQIEPIVHQLNSVESAEEAEESTESSVVEEAAEPVTEVVGESNETPVIAAETASESVSTTDTIPTPTDSNIASIGLSQVGYVPSEYNVTKFHSDLGEAQGQDWCGIFVWWCCVQAGREDLLPSNPRLSSAWSKGDNVVSADSGYTPKAGDIVYFARGHVAIVTDYRDGIVYTVEGNTYVPGYDLYGVWERSYPLSECTTFKIS